MSRFALIPLLICHFVALSTSSAQDPAAVIQEMNLARQNPQLYASFIEEMRPRFSGKVMVRPGGVNLRTKEGVGALDDAIRFLRRAKPQQPLALSPGLCRAAADHCADRASGGTGHRGSDRSTPSQRISRYGDWSDMCAENISYGPSSARDVVLALIIDDGLRHRKHRKNIFNATFNFAGAAFGPHSQYGTMCSMSFAGGYVENGRGQSDKRIARNF